MKLRWLVFGAFVAGVVVGERRRPLRRRVEPLAPRAGRNSVLAGLSAAMTHAAETAVILPLARWIARRRVGLLYLLPLPRVVRSALGFLLLDYTLWIWHWLNHHVPALWRFHLVHHVDLDLDASTGIRFHFGEMALSVVFRAGQVVIIGVEPSTLRAWEQTLVTSVIFHHSNVRLPWRAERVLARFIVSPRMHGIHHSIVHRETDSNFASLIAWWDWLHATIQLNVPQDDITIGVPAYQNPRDVTLPKMIRLPFSPQRNDWRLADGRPPAGHLLPGAAGDLAP